MSYLRLGKQAGSIGFLVLIFSLAVSVTQVTAQPVPCHLYTSTSAPSLFIANRGVPWNVFNPPELLLKAFCTKSSMIADVGPATYIYNQGYAWVNSQWQQVTFTCTGGQIVQNAWCPQSAQGTLPNNSTWYVAYTCTWTGSAWKCGCRDTACTTNYWQIQRVLELQGNINPQETVFFRDIETPPIKAKQSLGSIQLWNGAQQVLSTRAITALASINELDCEISMWVAAANLAGRRLVIEAFSPIIETLLTGGLSPLLSSFLSTSGTLLISETLGLSVRLLNDSAFNTLDTKDISDEAIKTLTHISIGYIAPLLTNDYFGGKIVGLLLNEGTDQGIQKLIQKEEAAVYQDRGSNQGSRNWPSPIVTAKIILIYSPYSHYVTLFLRAGGNQCSDDQAIFVLHYEADNNGLPIPRSEKEYQINLIP